MGVVNLENTIFEKELSAPAKLIYLVIEHLADSDGSAIISKDDFKKFSGYKNKKSIRPAIKELEEKGIIEVKENSNNGFSLPNIYRIVS